MKRVFAFLLVAVMVATLLAGCGGDAKIIMVPTTKIMQLTLMTIKQTIQLQQMVK